MKSNKKTSRSTYAIRFSARDPRHAMAKEFFDAMLSKTDRRGRRVYLSTADLIVAILWGEVSLDNRNAPKTILEEIADGVEEIKRILSSAPVVINKQDSAAEPAEAAIDPSIYSLIARIDEM